jgi:tRNA nucleotidyltransferase/poly(A) polymerase
MRKGELYLGYRPSKERVKEEMKKLIDEGKTKVGIRPLSGGSYIDFEVDENASC